MKVNKIIYVILIVLLCLWVVFSNRIMVEVHGGDIIYKYNEKRSFDDIVVYSVDLPEYIGGRFEEIYFSGWSFCETESDNSGKRVGIIIEDENKDNNYYCETIPGDRLDVKSTMETQGYKIKGSNHGFAFKFSAINIKNGKYRLYLYDVENDENSGLVDLNIYMIKQKRGNVIFEYIE